MKKIIYVVLFYFVHTHLALAQPAELNGKLRFAWGDEFNGTTINTDLWKVSNNNDNNGDGDGGVAVARNVTVSGGYLNCKILKEIYSCPTNDAWNCFRQRRDSIPYDYTYGRVESNPKYNQQFGYAEAMMHFPSDRGVWPAFWTFVGDGLTAFTNGGEIDIMERQGDSDAKTITTNVHLSHCAPGSPTTMCRNGIGAFCAAALPCWGEKHILAQEFWNSTKYAVYWSPTELVFYINDVAVRRMPNPGVVDPLKFIIGMGIDTKMVDNNNTFPATLYVDYIRVYSLYECLNSITVPIGQALVYNNGTEDILIACTKLDGNGTNGARMNLVATNSIALLPNMEVKEGGYLEARISSVGKEQSAKEELPMAQNIYYPKRIYGYTKTEVASEKAPVEEVFTVSPNPILNTATIKYSITKQAVVKIILYDIMGIMQSELVNENQSGGDHTYELNGLNYKAGIYLLVFESGGLTQKKTIVITR